MALCMRKRITEKKEATRSKNEVIFLIKVIPIPGKKHQGPDKFKKAMIIRF